MLQEAVRPNMPRRIVEIDDFIVVRYGPELFRAIKTERRDIEAVEARYAYFWLLSQEFGWTPGHIGRICGRDRTTVIYALEKLENSGAGAEVSEQFAVFLRSRTPSTLGIMVGQTTQE